MRAPILTSALAALSLLLASPAAAQELPADSTLQRLARERVETGATPGLVIGVIGPDGRSRVVAHGVRRAGGPPVDAASVFEIGSIGKVFTSTLLADMVARGLVSLDDPVQEFLPAGVTVPSRGGEITLLELSVQMSGLPRLPANMDPADPMNPYADYTVQDLYDFLSAYELPRDVGAAYEYSNLGMGLLGHALALRAGTSFEELVHDRITGPLGMPSTGLAFTPATRAALAAGHAEGGEPVPNWDMTTLAGAGGLHSSMEDMLKFLAANMFPDRSPIGEAAKLAQRPRREIGPGVWSGLNWIRVTPFGDTIVWHNGATGGYHAFLGFSPARKVGVVVLANASTNIDDIGMHVLDARAPLQPPKVAPARTEIAVAPEVLDAYVGVYHLTPEVTITIARSGDGLTAQLTGQQPLPIFAESETTFFLKVVDAQLEFTRDASGAVTGVVLHQNGARQTARKVR